MMVKIMLDAGHGSNTPGKRTLLGFRGVVKEHEMNNNVCKYIKEILNDYECEIRYSHDPSGNIDIALTERVSRCNAYDPDLFVSIHHNAFKNEWGNHSGVEVYYHTRGTAEDKKVANLVAPKLAKEVDLYNRGVKHAEFTVLTCNATAILIEGGFMDSNIDYHVITSEVGQKQYARAVADSIIEYLHLKEKPKEAATYWRVVAGSYTNKATATKIKADLEKDGYTGVWLQAYNPE